MWKIGKLKVLDTYYTLSKSENRCLRFFPGNRSGETADHPSHRHFTGPWDAHRATEFRQDVPGKRLQKYDGKSPWICSGVNQQIFYGIWPFSSSQTLTLPGRVDL